MDILSILSKSLISEPRHTGSLHCSTHLTDLDIHNVMDYYQFPRKDVTVGDFTRLETGNLWHDRVHGITAHYGAHEVIVDTGLPSGWKGTADLVDGSTLYDFKTAKSDVVKYLPYPSSTPLEKYLWQISAYYHALSAMGYWITDTYILYIPIDGGEFVLKPVDVLTKKEVWDRMAQKQEVVLGYDGRTLPAHPGYNYELKTVKSRKVHELYQVPPKYTEWCPFVDCPCQDMQKDMVASLTFDDEFNGDKKYESIIRSKL